MSIPWEQAGKVPVRFLPTFYRFISSWLLVALLFSSCGCVRRPPPVSGALQNDVYVWQRVWSAQSQTALHEASAFISTFVVLAAEVSLQDRELKIAKPRIDFPALRSVGHPVGLAIRIAPFRGSLLPGDQRINGAIAAARERLSQARAAGITPTELHLDFDCADSKLADYRAWLRQVRVALAPLPVIPTVLPSWLKMRDFAPLAREAGAYVLQVHSVEPPAEFLGRLGRLTDSKLALQWIESAGRLGVPFRVALPTYTYLVACDRDGKTIGISAEGPSSTWPAGTAVARWEADPAELADLVRKWTASRPAALRGLIWYRLPVAQDQLNWRMLTLRAVAEGRTPRRDLRIACKPGQPADLVLSNAGEQDEPFPHQIVAAWDSGSKLLAADALTGYEMLPTGSGKSEIVFRRREGAEVSRLAPGGQRAIGWVRCEPASPLHLSLVPDSPRSAFGSGATR